MNTDTTNENATLDAGTKQPLQLNVDVQEPSACERHVTVTIPRDEIERYFQTEFDELAPKAEVPGFRIGRAPRALIEGKFRKQISSQVKGKLLMDALTQIGEMDTYSAISEPDLDFEQVTIPEEGDMTFEFDIEVRPEFELPEWKGLTLERPEQEFSEQDIDDHLRRVAQNFADLVPVDEPIQPGDVIEVTIRSIYDGEPIAEYVEQTVEVRPELSLGDATIQDFEDWVTGAKAEETLKKTVTISPYADNEALQGKEVEIELEILDVKRYDEGAVADMAQKHGFESEDDLRTVIRESLAERLAYAQREKVREQITSLLTESADWELPPDLLRRQARRELDRAEMEMRSSGFSDEEIVLRLNSLRHNVMERTERILKEHFILERIAEENDVQDTPEDYALEIARIAAQQNDSPRRVRARLERTGQMDYVRNIILERKVIDMIMEHAAFEPTPIDLFSNPTTSALDVYLAGQPNVAIPEAKYDEGEPQALPTPKDRD